MSTRPLRASSRLAVVAAGAAVFALVGCGESTAPIEELQPPPPGQGVQFRMTSTIASGQEIERCLFVQAPEGGLNINHQEVRYTPGSHHVLLYLTPYMAIPTVDNHGKTRDTSGVIDCPEGAGSDWKLSGVLGGAQSFDGGSLVSLPPGVAVKVPKGAVLLINTHYLNAAPKDLVADARINIYTIPDADVKQEGGVIFFYNPIIRLPAMEKSSARMRCTIGKDITVTNVQSHMHRRAVNYELLRLDSTGKLVESMYTNTDWENVPVKSFEPGLKLTAGSMLDYRCDYINKEDHAIVQGPSTKDEMCMLIGSYYPRDDETAFCKDAVFVGSGTNTCGDALSCTKTALLLNDEEKLFGCLVDSCPAAAPDLTTAVRCYLSNGNGACKTSCSSPTGTSCVDCMLKACQPTDMTCAKASCG